MPVTRIAVGCVVRLMWKSISHPGGTTGDSPAPRSSDSSEAVVVVVSWLVSDDVVIFCSNLNCEASPP